MYLLCEGVDASKRILLTINNNYPQKKAVALQAYTTDGQAVELPSISLKSDQSKLMQLSDVLRNRGITSPLGFIKLTYEGDLMGVGAQLTLYPVSGEGGLDSARSLSVDFIDTRRTAAAWLPPGSKAVLAYSNVSDTAITVHAKTIGSKAEQFVVEPHATHITDIASAGDDSPLFDDLTSSGSIDSLRVSGYIVPRSGSPLPIRYYDPAAATTSHLTSVGLNPSDKTHISLYNTTGTDYTVIPQLRPASDFVSEPATAPTVSIPAGKAAYVSIGAALNVMKAQSVPLATLTLSTAAPQGALVGSLSQESAEVAAVEDIPLKTSNPQSSMRGAYPLRWDSDYQNKAMVTNTSPTQKTVSAFVIAENATYNFPPVVLQPFATHIYDVDSVREQQVPDFQGTRIPLSARAGKFHWTGDPGERDMGLLGRMQVTSRSEQRASSFSCGGVCPGPTIYPIFISDPYGDFVLGSTTISYPKRKSMDAYGNASWQPMSAAASGLSSSNSKVLAMTGDSTVNQVNLTGQNIGTSMMSYRQFTQSARTALGAECAPNPVQIVNSGGPARVAMCPTSISYNANKSVIPDLANYVPSPYLTGIGTLTWMDVAPADGSSYGVPIDENVSILSNNCPANGVHLDSTTLCSGNGTFIVGQGGGQFASGLSEPDYPNQFWDDNESLDSVSRLAPSGVSTCTAVCNQVFSCGGKPIATFHIQRVFTQSSIKGYEATRVVVTKQ